jgi:hypothetical protein
MRTLTLTQATGLLIEVAAEHPGYVYPYDLPEYVRAGRPCCIVAHVLHRAGWPIKEIAKADHANRMGGPVVARRLPHDVWMMSGIHLPAARLLDRAQVRQDRRMPWGLAVEAALAETWAAAS